MSLLQGFAPVNEVQASSVGDTLEAREVRAVAAFEGALQLASQGRSDAAQAALRVLLEDPVVVQGATDQLHRLKFLALKNLGDLLTRQPGTGVPDALALYCQATEVEADDALLWNRMGTLAAGAGYWAAARTAFERGLQLDPHHPTMPDKLLALLAHTGDTAAAATLASALLRQNPQHAGAAAALAAQQSAQPGGSPTAAAGGLLALPPVTAPAVGTARLALHGSERDRPRTLEQPTWQQLLHQSLLFLSANRLALDGGPSTPTAGGAVPGAERKGVHWLVRFNYKRPQPAQQQQPAAAAASAAGVLPAAGAAAATVAQHHPAGAGLAAAEPAMDVDAAPAPLLPEVVAAALAAASAQPDIAAGGAAAAGQEPAAAGAGDVTPRAVVPAATPVSAAAGAQAAPTAQAAQAAPTAQAALPTPASVELGGGAVSPRAAVAAECTSAVAEAADEEQEQRHPNGRACGRLEARATRSRAASGKAPLPLVPGDSSGHLATPDEEALELLSDLGSLLRAPQQAAPATAATPSALLSPRVGGELLPAPGVLSADQQQQQREAEERAVKAFIQRLPAHGIGRRELVLALLQQLGHASGAAALAPAARLQLLQVVHQVQHEGLPLPPETCLVLGELYTDAAAAASRGISKAAAAAAAAVTTTNDTSPNAPRRGTAASGGMRRSGSSIRTRRGELSPEALLQAGRLWLSRYRLAEAEEGINATAAASCAVPQASAGEPLAGMARYWWATGRLLESCGDMPAASAAYAHCQEALRLLGGRTLSLPYCQADSSISSATAHGKREALQLHTVLEEAGTAAAAGDHAAVVRTLSPVLLCCTDKEHQMHELDQAQWLSGMQILRAAAELSSSWALSLRCHLRLMNALLPVAPPALAPLAHGQEAAVAGVAVNAAAAALHSCAEQLVGRPSAGVALDAAASFLQKHRAMLKLAAPHANSSNIAQHDAAAGPQAVLLHPMEQAMYEAVQQQLALVLASCGAALGASSAAVESQLNIKVNAQRAAMCDAAAVLLHLDSLATGSRISVTGSAGGHEHGNSDVATMLLEVDRAQDVAWQLCDALGNVQALMERRGRFVEACMGELQSLLRHLDQTLPAGSASAAASAAQEVPSAEDLRTTLAGGLRHCLRWLYGLELPGLDKQEKWGGSFQAKGNAEETAARQLGSSEAVAAVWPMVEWHLLQDLEHVAKHRGFLRAAGEQFKQLPAGRATRSAVAWQQLAATEPPLLPCAELTGTAITDPMQHLLQLAPLPAAGGAEQAMEVDGLQAEGAAQPAAAAGEGAEAPGIAAVRRSLYHLLSALQDAEGGGPVSLLAPEAEAELEAQLAAAKADLQYNPGRYASWEKLAIDYHDAADDLLNEASKVMLHREFKHDRELQHRLRLWRRLAYWATAGAWLAARSDEDRIRLLAATGSRLLEDELRTLPTQDPLASASAWQHAKTCSAYKRSLRQAAVAFEAAAGQMAADGQLASWEVLLERGRCLRKLDEQPRSWLALLAQACAAARRDGGALLPLYTLHASRMRLLLSMPAAARWAGDGSTAQHGCGSAQARQQSAEEEAALLRAVGGYCFLPATADTLCCTSQDARGLQPPPAEPGRAADWRALLEDCCAAMRWCLEKDRNFHRATYRLADALQRTGQAHKAVALLVPLFSRAKQVFVPAMQPIQELKVDAVGKRGRSAKSQRMSYGSQQQQQHGEEAALSSLDGGSDAKWGRAPQRISAIGLQEDEATFVTRLRKTLRLYFSCLADAADAAAASGSTAPEAEAGRPPSLDVLQAAATYISSMPVNASKAWHGCDKLARGHFLLALTACIHVAYPLEQLGQLMRTGLTPAVPRTTPAVPRLVAGAQACLQMGGGDAGEQQLQALPHKTPGIALQAAYGGAPPASVAPASAAPGSVAHDTPAVGTGGGGARSLWLAGPTPTTHKRQQEAAQLLQVAAALDAGRAEPLLARAYQVFSDFSVHADGDDKWKAIAGPGLAEALSTSSSAVAADPEMRQLCAQPDSMRKVYSVYAKLYVHMLQHQGAGDKLLALLQAMKKRVKIFAGAEPKQARYLRQHALMLAEALLGAMEGSLSTAEVEAGTLARAQQAQQVLPAAGIADEPIEVEMAAGVEQQEQASPPPQRLPALALAEQSGSAPVSTAQPEAAVYTPAPGSFVHGSMPASDLRAMLGTPSALPSLQQQQLQERSTSLLGMAHSFQRDVARWLQLVSSATGSGSAAREEVKALSATGEDVLLRAFRLHARCAGQPSMQDLNRMGRAEQLKAAEEAAKQQRRQSRQQGAGRQQQGGSAATATGSLPPIVEAGDERAGPAARKRGEDAQLQTTRKRRRSGSDSPQHQDEGKEEEDEDREAVAAMLQVAVAGAVAAVDGDGGAPS